MAPSASDNAPQSPTPPADPGPGFDQVVAQLRQVVERLEAGSLTLEQSLAAFEEGVRLSRAGAQILDAAERRVEILLKGDNPDSDGSPGADRAPFAPQARGD